MATDMERTAARTARALDADRLARLDSPIHRLDARAKALAALALIVTAVRLAPGAGWKLVPLAAVVLATAALARVPARFVLSRAALALPLLLLFVVTAPFLPGPLAANLSRAGLTVAKALLSIAAATVLVATTPWHRLIEGLERLRVPRVFVLTLHFLHRYVFVLLDEVAAMRRAREARLCGRPRAALALASSAGIIGALFMRTLERSERIAAAMAARGFTGDVRTLDAPRFGARDALLLVGALAFSVGVALA